jgi:hypothetical protein
VPSGQSEVAGERIRLGGGFARVRATHAGSRYTTVLAAPRSTGADKVVIGHTLPRGSTVSRVELDGRAVRDYSVRTTNRGVEVTVPTTSGSHRLVVVTG